MTTKDTTRVVLPDVRLAYADGLLVAKAYQPGQPEKYGCTILLPPGHDGLEAIERALTAAAVARFGPKRDWPRQLKGLTRDPVIKDCADYPKIGITEKGWSFVRASSNDRPGIVDAQLREISPVDLRSEIYSGRWATVSVNAFPYARDTAQGVALGVGNLQLLGHGKRLGAARPTAAEEFERRDQVEDDPDSYADADELDERPRRSSGRR